MSGDARVLLEREGPVASLVLNAPERGNSLDAGMLTRLEELLLGIDPEVRVLLLRSRGERSFSTGYHLPSLLAEVERGLTITDLADHPLGRALRALQRIPVPTVAVVQGNTYGAGCELAITCDLRLAAEEAVFCLPPAKLGVVYTATGMRCLLELVGPAVLQEMLYTAEPVDGPRALSLGLVNRLVPRAELDGLAARTARTIAGNAPLAIRHTKTIIRRFLRPPELEADALRVVSALQEECFSSPEFRQRTQRATRRERPQQAAREAAG